MNKKDKDLRILYLSVGIILTAVEVLIALFVHDTFIRPYFGDMLVVVVLYAFVRAMVPKRWPLLPLYIFVFAASVEILQLFSIVDVLGLGGIPFFRVLIGSVCDVKDVLCYAVGCAFLGIHEYGMRRKGGESGQ